MTFCTYGICLVIRKKLQSTRINKDQKSCKRDQIWDETKMLKGFVFYFWPTFGAQKVVNLGENIKVVTVPKKAHKQSPLPGTTNGVYLKDILNLKMIMFQIMAVR